MIMGQRISELCSKGPYLEEDIAISNIALDYLGQANMLYELLKKAGGDKHSVDDYVFHRNERNYYNLLLVEQENGHFGKTMAKIFLYSTYQKILYSHLSKSTNDDIKAIQMLWDESVKLGMLKSAPNVRDTIWTETIIVD